MSEAPGHTRPLLPFDAEALARHRALVGRMASGDAEALQVLYFELNAIVNGIVRRVLANPEDAREAVQETFIKAWRNAAAFQADRGEVVSWLVFIARNAALDRVRQGARRRDLHEALRREPDDVTTLPLDHYATREELEWRLRRLPDRHRQAVELAFFGGCTQAQIAAAMRAPIGNVKNYLSRGLRKLRQEDPQP